jgi:putative tricarboxylic transport membrane protein
MKRDGRKSRIRGSLLMGLGIVSLMFFPAVGGKAAAPSADYPSRPIEYVVHSSPGGNNDIYARLVSDVFKKEKILSQPLVVLNKVGAGGGVAMGYVFEKKANPHVILNVSSGTHIVTTLRENVPYSIKSFTPIVNMAVDGCVLVVRSDSPFKTVNDLIAEAKKRPKELNQGGSSFTGHTNMMAKSIQKVKGVRWNFISFKNEAEALINVLSGNVHFAFTGPDIALDHVRAGKARVLLTAAPNRYPSYKDAPTVKEAGLGETIMVYRGIAGPPQMPDYAVKKLAPAFKKAMDSDQFKKFVDDSMMQFSWMPTDEYKKHLERENDEWKERLKELDLLKKK